MAEENDTQKPSREAVDPASAGSEVELSHLWKHMALTHNIHLTSTEEYDIKSAALHDYDAERVDRGNKVIRLECDIVEAREDLREARESLRDAQKILNSIQDVSQEIIFGHGNTGLSKFTTPVSVMYRLRDEVNTLRTELESEQEKALVWFIAYQELKTAVADTLMENRHLADGSQCTLKKLKDAYAKAKSAEASLDPQNSDYTTRVAY